MEGVVLAYRALGLGDLLAGIPALRGLRRAFGGDLLVATPAPLHPLLALAGLRAVACAPLAVPRLDRAPRLAPAFGTPSVTLFGPVPPDEWGPPAGGPHEVLWAGRRGDPHGQVLDPGLAAIGVEAVLSAAARAARRS